MARMTRVPQNDPKAEAGQRPSTGYARTIAMGVGLAVAVGLIGYTFFGNHGLSTHILEDSSTTGPPGTGTTGLSTTHIKPEVLLTREAIDLLLDAMDQAIRRKDVDAVIRHIVPDATITIHMRQGAQQQSAALTREEYQKTLAMGFAFPSASDFTRINTTVSLAPDERSAKVSYKSTETLRQPRRDIKIEGEATLIIKIREDKPVITSLEQVVPGDST